MPFALLQRSVSRFISGAASLGRFSSQPAASPSPPSSQHDITNKSDYVPSCVAFILIVIILGCSATSLFFFFSANVRSTECRRTFPADTHDGGKKLITQPVVYLTLHSFIHSFSQPVSRATPSAISTNLFVRLLLLLRRLLSAVF